VVVAGDEFAVNLVVSCVCGCDLRGAEVMVTGHLDPAQSVHPVGGGSGGVRLIRRAPTSIGEETLTLRLEPAQPTSTNHRRSATTLSYAILPHECSFAVWEIPATVTAGHPFTPIVGVTCSRGCCLGGESVEILDEEGAVAVRAVLSNAPWAGTHALYTAGVTLCAPPAPGRSRWTFRIVHHTADSIPHSIEDAMFECITCLPPEHQVTVTLSDAQTRVPIDHAEVRLGPYLARTNERGIASVAVARGTYLLDAWKAGYNDCDGGLVEVDGDTEIALETSAALQTSADDERVWM